jgi:phage shock protein PspC (stress-responsive transcriptional regulator)
MEKNKRLYRSAKSKVFGGVAGGIAEYFDIDPIIIRLLFVIIAFAGGGGAIVYLILWIALPLEPLTIYNMNMGSADAADAGNPDAQATSDLNPGASDSFKMPVKTENRSGLIGGIILISLGLIFLANRFIPNINFSDLWPLLLVVLGGVLIATSFAERKGDKKE